MAEEDQGKSESATPHKLEEARKKGSVPKSIDINVFLMLLSASAAIHFFAAKIAVGEMQLFVTIFSHAHEASFVTSDIANLTVSLVSRSLSLIAPLFLVLVIVTVLSNFAQSGPVFSFFPLKPDLNRINPIAGFKKIFSTRLLMEATKSILKFVIFGAVIWFAISDSLPALLRAIDTSPNTIARSLVPLIDTLLGRLLVALAFITVIDVGYSQWDFSRRMRMSRREIKDEVKRREGDPRVKSRVRELQREVVKRAKSFSRVKDADVLITNPTRLAIALKYDRTRIDAPVVVSKGAGVMAWRIRTLARRYGIPIIENRPLARALFYKVGIDQAVPSAHYDVLARIMIWANSVRRGRA